MENEPQLGRRIENIRQGETLSRLVDRVIALKDPELSYCCICLYYGQLADDERAAAIAVVVDSADEKAPEMAFRLLRDRRDIDHRFRDQLISRIYRSMDQTIFSLTLQFVALPDDWSQKFRQLLSETVRDQRPS